MLKTTKEKKNKVKNEIIEMFEYRIARMANETVSTNINK